ncbi:unnamed protein product, partial [Owenia fusiformis]
FNNKSSSMLAVLSFGWFLLGLCLGEVDIILDDVDCTNQHGFKPVGFLASSYKDCVFVVCDGSNPDPGRVKYPWGCNTKFQVNDPYNEPGGPLKWPGDCPTDLSVRQCLAYTTQLCKLEESTQDNVACGPTFAELKGEGGGESQDAASLSDDYVIFGDPHIYQGLVNISGTPAGKQYIRYRVEGTPETWYTFWEHYWTETIVDCLIISDAPGSPMRFVSKLIVRTTVRDINIEIVNRNELRVTLGDLYEWGYGVVNIDESLARDHVNITAPDEFKISVQAVERHLRIHINAIHIVEDNIGGILGDFEKKANRIQASPDYSSHSLVHVDGTLHPVITPKLIHKFRCDGNGIDWKQCWQFDNLANIVDINNFISNGDPTPDYYSYNNNYY